jgi:hypothetical protein
MALRPTGPLSWCPRQSGNHGIMEQSPLARWPWSTMSYRNFEALRPLSKRCRRMISSSMTQGFCVVRTHACT